MVSGGKDADAEGEGEIDNLKLTFKLGAQYKLSKNFSIGFNTDYIILSDKVNPANDFSELAVARLMYWFAVSSSCLGVHAM